VYTATYKVMKGSRVEKVFYDGWSADHYMEGKPGLTVEHEYVVTDARKGTEPVYEPEFTMMFPRMYSSQANHVDAYKEWSGFKGIPCAPPTARASPLVV
jgi:hypothetical protein